MKINIISNDKRYEYLNELLKNDGYQSEIRKISDDIDADFVILPIKKEHSEEELLKLFYRLKGKTKILSAYGEGAINYADNEGFLKKNAYLTAEGAVSLYYEATKETLLSKKIVLLGYGRIAKYLAKMLKNQGADVYIYARREEVKTEAFLDGFIPVEIGAIKDISPFAIFNTIPSEIFKEQTTAYKLELASKRGFKYTENVINGGGLPGKMFPKTAAEFIYEAIIPILTSMEKT